MPTAPAQMPMARGRSARVEHVGDDRQRLRHDGRGAQAHRRARPDQLIRCLRVRGDQREQAERHQADHQHPLAADPVADHPEGEQQPGEHQGVGVDPPLQLALAGAEAVAGLGDRLERDVQHGVVEHDRHQAGDQDAEDEPAAAVDPVLGPAAAVCGETLRESIKSFRSQEGGRRGRRRARVSGRPGRPASYRYGTHPYRKTFPRSRRSRRRHVRPLSGASSARTAGGRGSGRPGCAPRPPHAMIEPSGDATLAPRDVEDSR